MVSEEDITLLEMFITYNDLPEINIPIPGENILSLLDWRILSTLIYHTVF